MARLELDGLHKVFDDDGSEVRAVEGLSIDVADGEFLVLVGPSGCGKSTTLRMIAGLESTTEGSIRLGGRTIDGRDAHERDIAMVFQSYALYPHMTVRENMAFGLEESTDLPDEEITTRVEETAALLGIDELLHRQPTDLSGGQRQRVALGRAIVREPKVFLMDEPLSNLDAKLRAEMRTELQRLQEELGTTTIYVTHDQTEAMTMGDRIAILNDGQLQQVATPLEAYHDPANRFVAGFIGEPSINFFETRVTDDGLVADGFTYPLSPETRDAVASLSRVTMGVRPEDVQLKASVESAHDFETTVDVVEPMGDRNNVHLTFDAAGERTFVATVSGDRTVTEGESVVARLPESALHLFHGDTGEALLRRSPESGAMRT